MSHLSYRSVFLLALSLTFVLVSCDSGKGKLRLQGQFQNLDQADFLIYSSDGAFPDIDTLHLVKGRFEKEIPLQKGSYTFTLIYPNFQTLSFLASEGKKVSIVGDALALADVKVSGADSVVVAQPTEAPSLLKVGGKLPKVSVIEQNRRKGKYLLIGFWANWKGGTNVVRQKIGSAQNDYPDLLSALAYSLDTDPKMYKAARSYVPGRSEEIANHCDYQGWDSPAVRQFGIDRIPYYILVNPQGKVVALGTDYAVIEKELCKLSPAP